MAILGWMLRRRRLEVAYLLGSLLLLAASLHPPTAYAAPGDPPSGSPAGAVYQLPLEQGRSDAAPKGSGGTGASGGSTGAGTEGAGGGASQPGETGSLYRSENNFGSSSRVPGVAAGAGTGGGGGGAGAGGAGTPGAGGAAAGSGAGGAAIAAGAVAAETAGEGNTSVAAGAILLGAIALLAVAVGVLSRRFSQGRAGS